MHLFIDDDLTAHNAAQSNTEFQVPGIYISGALDITAPSFISLFSEVGNCISTFRVREDGRKKVKDKPTS